MTGERKEALRAAVHALAEALENESGVLDYQPAGDRVLVLPIKAESGQRRVGSLYLPDTGKDASYGLARVIAVGPGIRSTKTGKRLTLDVDPGDTVVVGNRVGEPLVDGDVEYRLVRAADILATVDGLE